ncbi:YidB family protein [Thiomonas sp.]|uniref:YidB family protein n=1 Tax=Thiomonas sp. TaxID=2047785 RepID=UPI0026171CBF|nr:YidB family protein [Thiomonas sp.]
MGLLDDALGALGAGGPDTQGLLQAAAHLVQQQPGGLDGLAQRFEQAGLGDIVHSWIGAGANAPVSAEQIQQVLDAPMLADLADKLGVDPQQAASSLAQVLPQLVDHLTPGGSLPGAGEVDGMLQQGLSALAKRLFAG